MTDLCETTARKLIEGFELTPETTWTWNQHRQRWQFLESKSENDDEDENFLLKVRISERINEYVQGLSDKQVYGYLQSTSFNPFESEFVLVDWAGYEFSSIVDVLRMLLSQSIEGLFVELLPKPKLKAS